MGSRLQSRIHPLPGEGGVAMADTMIPEKCPSCDGDGACPFCGGNGEDEHLEDGICGECDGSGECPECNGSGKV